MRFTALLVVAAAACGRDSGSPAPPATPPEPARAAAITADTPGAGAAAQAVLDWCGGDKVHAAFWRSGLRVSTYCTTCSDAGEDLGVNVFVTPPNPSATRGHTLLPYAVRFDGPNGKPETITAGKDVSGEMCNSLLDGVETHMATGAQIDPMARITARYVRDMGGAAPANDATSREAVARLLESIAIVQKSSTRATANGTTLEVRSFEDDGACTKALLRELAASEGADMLATVGFKRLRCDPEGHSVSVGR